MCIMLYKYVIDKKIWRKQKMRKEAFISPLLLAISKRIFIMIIEDIVLNIFYIGYLMKNVSRGRIHFQV